MKKNLLTIFLAISTFSLLAFYSCSNKGNEMPVSNSTDYEFSDMVFPTFGDILGEEVIGGTIDTDFDISLKSSSNSKSSQIQCGDHDGYHHRRGCAYGTILYKLHLTKDQKTQIFQFKKAFHSCVNDARRYYQSEKGKALKASCLNRKEIIKKWKDGEINRAEACNQLKTERNSLKSQIGDLKADFKAAFADCLCTFLQNIISVLDKTQNATFITWVSNNDCINAYNCDLDGGGGPIDVH